VINEPLINIENVSCERCLSLYDSPDTFFFLDHPYLNAKPDAYAGWAEDELRTFRSRVAKLQGRWIVTLDDSPFNRELLTGCRIKSVQTKNGCVNNRELPDRHFSEIIITPE
jgi:DNA adenine methylase